jgi:hypothetical protein
MGVHVSEFLFDRLLGVDVAAKRTLHVDKGANAARQTNDKRQRGRSGKGHDLGTELHTLSSKIDGHKGMAL